MDNNSYASSIDNGIGQFAAEASNEVIDETPLFDISAYPEDQRAIIVECNKRIEEANSKYRLQNSKRYGGTQGRR